MNITPSHNKYLTLDLRFSASSQDINSYTNISAEEQGAGRKTLEGSVAVVLMPMLSETQLRYIQSKTTYFADIVRSLWGYLAANYANLHHRVVKLLWKLHHLAPSPDITEDVIGAMLSSNLVVSVYFLFSLLCTVLYLLNVLSRDNFRLIMDVVSSNSS